jgi:hypothetical protein
LSQKGPFLRQNPVCSIVSNGGVFETAVTWNVPDSPSVLNHEERKKFLNLPNIKRRCGSDCSASSFSSQILSAAFSYKVMALKTKRTYDN